jgi:hypothetical protein
MFLLDGKPLPVDVAFTHDDIQYPANWLRLATAKQKKAIGITEEADPVRADDRFYWNGDINNPKDLAGLKTQFVGHIRSQASNLLSPTDWKVIRATEAGDTIEDELKSQRQAIRTKCNNFEAEIMACKKVADLAAMQFNWE